MRPTSHGKGGGGGVVIALSVRLCVCPFVLTVGEDPELDPCGLHVPSVSVVTIRSPFCGYNTT